MKNKLKLSHFREGFKPFKAIPFLRECHSGNVCVDTEVLVGVHVAVPGLDHYDGFF